MAPASTRRIMQRFLYFLFLSACLCLLELLSFSEINLTHTLPRSENFTKSVFSISNFSQPASHIKSSKLAEYLCGHSYAYWTKENFIFDGCHLPWEFIKISNFKIRKIYTHTNITSHHKTRGNFINKAKRKLFASECSLIGGILQKLRIPIPELLVTQILNYLHIYPSSHNETFDIRIHKLKTLGYVAGSRAIGGIFHNLEILTYKFWTFQNVDFRSEIRMELNIQCQIQLLEASNCRYLSDNCSSCFITAFWTTCQKCTKISSCGQIAPTNLDPYEEKGKKQSMFQVFAQSIDCLAVVDSESDCHPARSAVIYVRSLQISCHIELSFVHNISLHTPKTLLPLHDHTLASVSVSVSASVSVISVVSASDYEKIFFIHYVKNPLQNFFHAYVCPDYKWSDTTHTLRLQHHPSHVFATAITDYTYCPNPGYNVVAVCPPTTITDYTYYPNPGNTATTCTLTTTLTRCTHISVLCSSLCSPATLLTCLRAFSVTDCMDTYTYTSSPMATCLSCHDSVHEHLSSPSYHIHAHLSSTIVMVNVLTSTSGQSCLSARSTALRVRNSVMIEENEDSLPDLSDF